MGRRSRLVIKSHTPWVANPQTGEVLPQEWEFCAPHWVPQPEAGGVLHRADKAPRAFGFEGQWGLTEEPHRTRGNKDITLKGCTQPSCALGPRVKAVLC